MKIYASRIDKNKLDRRYGDLELLQSLCGDNNWYLIMRSTNSDSGTVDDEQYIRINDIKDDSYIIGDIFDINYDMLGVKYAEIRDTDITYPIYSFGTLIKPIESLSDEEVREFIEKYGEYSDEDENDL